MYVGNKLRCFLLGKQAGGTVSICCEHAHSHTYTQYVHSACAQHSTAQHPQGLQLAELSSRYANAAGITVGGLSVLNHGDASALLLLKTLTLTLYRLGFGGAGAQNLQFAFYFLCK